MASFRTYTSILTFFLALLLNAPFIASAQIKIHRAVNVEEGLIQSQIMSLHEDRHGFLWIGTLGGLSRWDGERFVNYTQREGLPSSGVHTICETLDGRIIVGTNGGGAAALNNNKFHAINAKAGLPDLNVRSILQTPDSALWIATDKGLCVFRGGYHDSARAEILLKGQRISCMAYKPGVGLLVGSYTGGVFAVNNFSAAPFLPDQLAIKEGVRAIYESSNGILYISVDQSGVAVVGNGSIQWLNKKNGLGADRIHSLREGQDGKMYFGSIGNGLIRYDGVSFENISDSNGLSNNTVWALTANRSGSLIIGTWAGLNFYDYGKFISYDRSSGLTDPIVLSIREGQDGKFYFGTAGGGVNVLNSGAFTAISASQGLKDLMVWSIHENNEGLLFGTNNSGIYTYANGIARPVSGNDDLLDKRIYSMAQDGGDLYIGNRMGVNKYTNKTMRTLDIGAPWNRGLVYSLFINHEGDLYMATRNGVLRKRGDKIDTLDTRSGLSDTHAWCVYEDKMGALYIGTNSGGLNIIGENKIVVLDVTNGLADNTVYGILEDDQGRIYATGNKGVAVITDGGNGYSIRTIRRKHGLIGDECNQGAVYKDRRGRLWFGTNRGVTCYDPDLDKFDPPAPVVHLTKLRMHDKEVSVRPNEAPREFAYHDNYFQADYVGIHLSSPKSVTYRYRMRSVDDDWIETDRTYVQYPNLNDGAYTFEVMAKNERGVWSDPLIYSFTIRPPFWETWWFLSLCFISLGGITGYIIYTRVQRTLAVERLRNKISADFHDTIGAGLTQVHLLSQTALMQIEKKEQVVKNLSHIDDISKSLYEEMRDIIWLISPKKDSLYDLILRLKESFADVAEQRGIELTTQNIESLSRVHLSMEKKQHIFMIFKEAINNSLKYSRCTQLTLKAELHQSRFRILLSDNGVGLEDGKIQGGGQGLIQMRERAQKAGGSVSVRSEPGKGVTVEFESAPNAFL
jgi:ligand-binding sensor domain-containing protein